MAFGRKDRSNTVSDNRKNTRDFAADTVAALREKHALLTRYGGDADDISAIETKLAELGAPIDAVIGEPADGETGPPAEVVDSTGATHTGELPTGIHGPNCSPNCALEAAEHPADPPVPPVGGSPSGTETKTGGDDTVETKSANAGDLEKAVPQQPAQANASIKPSAPAKKAAPGKRPPRQSGAPASGKQGDEDEKASE